MPSPARAVRAGPHVRVGSHPAGRGRTVRRVRRRLGDTGRERQELLEDGVFLTRVRSGGASWSLTLLRPDREVLSRTYERCEESGLSLAVDSICEPEDDERGRFGLTESQYTTLVEARRRGDHGVPRDATLSELAAALGISHQAFSERLRRDHGNLVSRTLSTWEPDEEPTGSIPP